jgi:hypothetical protein
VDEPRVVAEVTDAELVVRCLGSWRFWSLRSEVRVPRDRITSARLVPRDEAAATIGWKLAGTYVNRRRLIGGFFTIRGVKGGRQWWAAPKGDPVLVVEVEGQRWQRMVVRVDDQERLASILGASEPGR